MQRFCQSRRRLPLGGPVCSQRHHRVLKALTILLAVGIALPAPAAQDKAAAKQKELSELRTRIAGVRKEQEAAISRRSRTQQELRRTERKIGALSREIATLDARISTASDRLNQLRVQQTAERKTVAKQKKALADQILSAYMTGRQEELKLFLNQEDPALLGRMLADYDYFNRARAARISSLNAHLQKLSQLGRSIKNQIENLGSMRHQRTVALADLTRSRDERKAVVAKLTATIRAKGEQLKRLQNSEKSLGKLLASLRHALSDIPSDLEHRINFSLLRGRLSWPVQGRVMKRYGQSLAEGRLRWRGDLITAPLGAKVRAISYGRVAYASWLPHFGLLVIIDHGDGYMSLYAHNQSLYTQVGDWVEAGAVIATVGDSGGQKQPALYFEIRHGNDTLPPARWCRGTPSSG